MTTSRKGAKAGTQNADERKKLLLRRAKTSLESSIEKERVLAGLCEGIDGIVVLRKANELRRNWGMQLQCRIAGGMPSPDGSIGRWEEDQLIRRSTFDFEWNEEGERRMLAQTQSS